MNGPEKRERMSKVEFNPNDIKSFADVIRFYTSGGQTSEDDRDFLDEFFPNFPVNSRKEAGEFLEALQLYRAELMRGMKHYGHDWKSTTIDFLKTNSSSSIYDGKNRYIYELIQNADDCKGNEKTEKISFTFLSNEDSKDQLVIEYNGNKFRSTDVFAITGIANSNKNKSDKEESNKETNLMIGEKGLGFKTVFGIADKVHIRSGFFSFSIDKENYMVPIPDDTPGEDFNGVCITLDLSEDYTAANLYKNLIKYYSEQDIIYKKNPVLFLKNIRQIRFCHENKFLEFSVEEEQDRTDYPDWKSTDGLAIIKSDMTIILNSSEADKKKSFKCRKYETDIPYSEEILKDRFSEELVDSWKNSKGELQKPRICMQILFPEDKEIKGQMYSFFPLEGITTTVPLIINAPYKLAANREGIDSNPKKWYKATNQYLQKFIKQVYPDYADSVKEDILFYLPYFNKKPANSFFKSTDENSDFPNWFSKEQDKTGVFSLLTEPLFYCYKEGTFQKYENIKIIDWHKPDQKEISVTDNRKEIEGQITGYYDDFRKENNHFFYLNDPAFSSRFDKNKRVGISEASGEILKRILFEDVSEETCKIIFKLLGRCGLSWKYELGKIRPNSREEKTVNFSAVSSLFLLKSEPDFFDGAGELYEEFPEFAGSCLHPLNLPPAAEIILSENAAIWKLFMDKCSDSELSKWFRDNKLFFADIEGYNENFYLKFKNGLMLGKTDYMLSLERYIKEKDEKHHDRFILYKNSVIISNTRLDNDQHLEEFVRQKEFESVTEVISRPLEKLITRFGENPEKHSRLIYELLQNADDCHYRNTTELPKISIIFGINKKEMVLKYNEDGFSEEDIKSITSIYQSDKKITDEETTGHMGIGFKSVFAVANRVTIWSKKEENRLWHFEIGYPDYDSMVPTLLGVEIWRRSKEGDLWQYENGYPKDNTGNFLSGQTKGSIEKNVCGTEMTIEMKNLSMDFYRDLKDLLRTDTESSILKNFICLKSLKNIEIVFKTNQPGGEKKVEIEIREDEPGLNRTMVITGENGSESYVFKKTITEIDINTDGETRDRMFRYLRINKEEKISPKVILYVPENKEYMNSYCFYNGLPTTEVIETPFIVDAPFELNEFREKFLQNSGDPDHKWNELVRDGCVKAIVDFINFRTKEYGLKSAWEYLFYDDDGEKYWITEDGGYYRKDSERVWFSDELKRYGRENLLLPVLNAKGEKAFYHFGKKSIYADSDKEEKITPVIITKTFRNIILNDSHKSENFWFVDDEDGLYKEVLCEDFKISKDFSVDEKLSVLGCLREWTYSKISRYLDLKDLFSELSVCKNKSDKVTDLCKNLPIWPVRGEHVCLPEGKVIYCSFSKEDFRNYKGDLWFEMVDFSDEDYTDSQVEDEVLHILNSDDSDAFDFSGYRDVLENRLAGKDQTFNPFEDSEITEFWKRFEIKDSVSSKKYSFMNRFLLNDFSNPAIGREFEKSTGNRTLLTYGEKTPKFGLAKYLQTETLTDFLKYNQIVVTSVLQKKNNTLFEDVADGKKEIFDFIERIAEFIPDCEKSVKKELYWEYKIRLEKITTSSKSELKKTAGKLFDFWRNCPEKYQDFLSDYLGYYGEPETTDVPVKMMDGEFAVGENMWIIDCGDDGFNAGIKNNKEIGMFFVSPEYEKYAEALEIERFTDDSSHMDFSIKMIKYVPVNISEENELKEWEIGEKQERSDIDVKKVYALFPDSVKESLLKELKDEYPSLMEQSYKTLSGKLVRSKEEIIILDRIEHFMPAEKNQIPVEYEPKGIETEYCGYIPDFRISINAEGETKIYIWEHLGYWQNDAYREHNLKKLKCYYELFRDNPDKLPRLSFPLNPFGENASDERPEGKNKKEETLPETEYLKITSSEENIRKFLQTNPEGIYRRLLGIDDPEES